MAHIALVDDHPLLRNGLASLVTSLGHQVVLQASNGKEFISLLEPAQLPNLVMMDINMPEMDGYETATWLKQNHPKINVMALSMLNSETSIIRMIKCGAKGYVLKDSSPAEIKEAIETILDKGFYYSEAVNSKIINVVANSDAEGNEIKQLSQLTSKELEFLKLVCTEMSYKEIAEKMQLGHRSIEYYRDNLFEKTKAMSRIGLAMFAVRNGIVHF